MADHPIRGQTVFFGLGRVVRTPSGRNRVSPIWTRILAVMAVVVVGAWLLGAAGLYLLFKFRHDYDDVQFTKMVLLPFRLDEHRREMGDFHVERAMELLREGEGRDGFRLLRLGLARSRANIEARQALAEIYTLHFSRPDMAADVLRDGIGHADKEPGFLGDEYLRQYLRLLINFQLDEEMIREGSELLRDPRISEEARLMTALGVATAHGHRGNFLEAQELIEGYNLTRSPEGILLVAHIDWLRGNRARAIRTLSHALDRRGFNPQIFSTLLSYYRESERYGDVRRRARLAAIEFPDNPAPLIQLLYAHHEEGNVAALEELVDELLEIADDPNSLEQVAAFASTTADSSLAARVYEVAMDHDFSPLPFLFHLVTAEIREGLYETALLRLDAFEMDQGDMHEQFKTVLSSMRAVALYGLGRVSEARPLVRAFIEDFGTRPEFRMQLARQFEWVGAPEVAREILEVTASRNPYDQRIVLEMVKLDIRSGATDDLLRNVRRLLTMRIPERSVLEETYQVLGSDRYLFSEGRQELLDQISARM